VSPPPTPSQAMVRLFEQKDPEQRYYIVDGEVYDLREWIPLHPGGARWFSRSNGRDISPAIHAYHANPKATVYRILEKYKVNKADLCKDLKEITYPGMNIPPFVLPPEFDAHKEGMVPTFTYKDEGILAKVQKKLSEPVMRKKIRQMDYLFDAVAAGIFMFHLFLCFPVVYYGWIHPVLLIPLMACVRTSLAGAGHYHCHRAKTGWWDWADMLFDIQYVGAHVVTYDGHVMLHHFYTNSPADVKRTAFTGLLTIPRLWRVPVNTIHRFGNFLTGMVIRWYYFNKEAEPQHSEWPLIKHVQFFAIRGLMYAEFAWALYYGAAVVWFGQFCMTLWWNLFLIVASHDFEESETQADLTPGQDWGTFQVKHSFDMYVTGSPWVDTFLTAGLGTHRVHHLLPYQGSGFANIVSQPTVKEVCEQSGMKWDRSRSFFAERLPTLANLFLLAPAQLPGIQRKVYGKPGVAGFLEEQVSPLGWKCIASLIYTGFMGEGSI